jgi:hypothetical protein
VVPPDQGFEPDNAAGGELDLWLVVELELVLFERNPELIGDAHALMHLQVEVLTMEAEAEAPDWLPLPLDLRQVRHAPASLSGPAFAASSSPRRRRTPVEGGHGRLSPVSADAIN